MSNLNIEFILSMVDSNMQETLENMENSVKNFQNGTNESFSNMKKTMSTIGGGFTKFLTLPILAAGAGILKVASDFDEIEKSYKASTNATEAQVKQHVENVKNVYKKGIGETASDVSSIMSEIETSLTSFNLKDSEIENLTAQMMQFSKVTDSDVSESIRGLKAIMTSFNLTASEGMDFLVAGTQKGLNFSDELGDNLAEYSTLFKQNGYSINQMFDILQAGTDNGVYNLDKMNDLIKEFGIRTSNGDTEKAVQNLGGAWSDLYQNWSSSGGTQYQLLTAISQQLGTVTSETERAAIASQIFGTLGEDVGLKTILSLGNIKSQYDNINGSSSKMVNDSLTLQQRFQSIGREILIAFEPFGRAMLDLIEKYLPQITQFFQDMANFVNGLSEGQVKFILGFVAFLALIGPILSGIATIISIIQGLIAIFGVLSAVSLGWVAVIAVVVIAVIAAAIAIWKNWDVVKKVLVDVGKALASAFTYALNVVKGVYSSISQFIGSAVDIGVNFISGIAQGIMSGFNAIKSTIEKISSYIVGTFKKVFKIHSPSRLLRDEVGRYLSLGIADGLISENGKIDSSISNIRDNITAGLNTEIKAIPNVNTSSVNNSLLTFNGDEKEKQPLNVVLKLGNNLFKAFVEDITEEQAKNENLAYIYGGD